MSARVLGTLQNIPNLKCDEQFVIIFNNDQARRDLLINRTNFPFEYNCVVVPSWNYLQNFTEKSMKVSNRKLPFSSGNLGV